MAVIETEMQPAVMMQQLGFDYTQIDEACRDEVQAAARSIHQLERGVMTGLIAIGKRLIEVKGMLPHGQFAEWCEAEFELQPRMAQNLMNVAREYGDGQKRNIISLFSPTVGYLLAAPSTPEDARAEVEQAAASGQRVTVEFAKEVVRKARPEPDTPLLTLENMIYEWVCNHARETSYNEDDVLRFVAEGATTRADKERKRMATWLTARGCTWREGILERSTRRMWERRQRELRQAQAQTVYVEQAQIDKIVRDLCEADRDDSAFTEALRTATMEQLEAALRRVPQSDQYRWLKIGKRRELLESARWANSLEATVEASRELEEGSDPEEAAAIAEVAAEREQEEAERVAKDGVIDDGRYGMVHPMWVMDALTKAWPDNADFKSALRMVKLEDLREAMASLSTEEKHHVARLAAFNARWAELVAASVTVTMDRGIAEKLLALVADFELRGLTLVEQSALEEALASALNEVTE